MDWLPIQKLYEGRSAKGGYPFSRRKTIATDVRNFVRDRDWVVEALMIQQIYELPLAGIRELRHDDILYRAQNWVTRNILYADDAIFWSVPEYWQYPEETLVLKGGDCEDGAILLCTILRIAGIRASRIRVRAGWVDPGAGAAAGGHAYCVYLTDDAAYPIDWCYFPEQARRISDRTPLSSRREYGDAWFVFNDCGAWGPPQATSISGRLKARRLA